MTQKTSHASSSLSAWARLSVLLAGSSAQDFALQIAAHLAEALGAELRGLFVPPDPADLAPWLGEGMMGSVQLMAMANIKEVTDKAHAHVSQAFAEISYGDKHLKSLQSPVWQALASEVRLSDLIVFSDESARGRGMLSEAFQQVLMEERAAVFIARTPLDLKGTVLVAWDGKEPASRAARRALPLLRHASEVIVTGAPHGDYPADLEDLADYYRRHGLKVSVLALAKSHDIGQALVEAYQSRSCAYLVAGAYGHSRFSEFAFGGTTRALLNQSQINLFMAH